MINLVITHILSDALEFFTHPAVATFPSQGRQLFDSFCESISYDLP